MSTNSPDAAIALIRIRIAEIDRERQELVQKLDELENAQEVAAKAPVPDARSRALTPTVTNASPAAEKIALFRRLFGGRTDVFPVRWDNPKTGRSGYAPACANEWVRGICGKPQVKCRDCTNRAFIPVTPDVIECHLRGEDRVRPSGRGGAFVIGVYPLLFDDTCTFFAAISTRKVGSRTRWHSLPRPARSACLLHWSARGRGTVGTSGYSSLSPSLRLRLGASERCCSPAP